MVTVQPEAQPIDIDGRKPESVVCLLIHPEVAVDRDLLLLHSLLVLYFLLDRRRCFLPLLLCASKK